MAAAPRGKLSPAGRAARHATLLATTDLVYDQRVARAALSLHEAGWDVRVLGRSLPASPPLPDRPYIQDRLTLPLHTGPGFYALYQVAALRWLRRHHPEGGVIIANDIDTLPAAAIAARGGRAALVLDAHEYFSQVPELIGRSLVQGIWARLERTLPTRAQALITVSPPLAEALSTLWGRPVTTVRNVPLASDYVGLHGGAKQVPGRVVYAGALNAGRGLEALIDSVAYGGHEVSLAGEGDLSSALRERAAALPAPARDRVKFMGYLPPPALRAHLATGWVGYSLLEGARGLSYELSLSNKFFDYMHLHLPQLAPDLPAYRILNEPAPLALLMAEPDPATIAAALSRLQADQALYGALSDNARKAAPSHGWEREKTIYTSLIEQVWRSHYALGSEPGP